LVYALAAEGLIEPADADGYRYQLTEAGREVLAIGVKEREQW
jgi:hypothetical protein